MRKYLILIIILFLIFSCSDNDILKPKLTIIKNKEIVDTNELFTAKIFIYNIDTTVYPQFYIISGSDTLLLQYDNINMCGIYRSRSRSDWKGKINGFVKFKQNNGHISQLNYDIKYEIKTH